MRLAWGLYLDFWAIPSTTSRLSSNGQPNQRHHHSLEHRQERQGPRSYKQQYNQDRQVIEWVPNQVQPINHLQPSNERACLCKATAAHVSSPDGSRNTAECHRVCINAEHPDGIGKHSLGDWDRSNTIRYGSVVLAGGTQGGSGWEEEMRYVSELYKTCQFGRPYLASKTKVL